MKDAMIKNLMLEALETELGGVQVYIAALTYARNDELREEWAKYLDQTRHHVEVLRECCRAMGIDAETRTPGRGVVKHIGQSLVKAMQMAGEAGDPAAAELVAAECVVLAETKDHHNWGLLGEIAKARQDAGAQALRKAHAEIEDEEDEHLYHTQGWARELWIQALGLPAVLPPPEEVKDVRSAAAAAHAKKDRRRERGESEAEQRGSGADR
jgi:hypothetical protein